MATSLASQLQKLATPQTSLLDEKRRKVSLLFDSSDAATYGKDVYYEIGLSGFEELLKIDSAFNAFKDSLFGKVSKDFQRAVADKASNITLDKEIEHFLLLASPYLERQATIKAIEWLVYRYMIHAMNRESLLMCIMPYYESPLFIRVLQIIEIRIKTDPLYWLKETQKAGRPMSKKTIFSRWINSQDFRAFLCKYLEKMLKVHQKESNCRIAIAFYISTIVGAICLQRNVTEEQLTYIVKMLPTCLLSKHEELVAGMYLILSQMAVNAKLSSDLLQKIIKLLAKVNGSDILEQHCASCLVILSQHQDIEAISSANIVLLNDKPQILQKIGSMASTKSVAPFLCAYITGFIRWLLESTDLSEKKKKAAFVSLMEYVLTLRMSVSDATRVIRSVLEVWHKNFEALQNMKDYLPLAAAASSLEVNYPDGYSKAIADFASSKKEGYKQIIDEILNSGGGSSGTSVKFVHMVHPDDAVRLAAAEKFARRLSKGLVTDKKLIELNMSYMLADDSPDVVVEALSIAKVEDAIDNEFFVNECKKLIKKSEIQGKPWRLVKKKSVECLSERLFPGYDEKQKNDILYVLLPYVLCPQQDSDVRIAKSVLKSQFALDIPILKTIGLEMGVLMQSLSRKDYAAKIWEILPQVIHKAAASDTSLWKIVKNQLNQEKNLPHQFISLVLLYFGLKDSEMDIKLKLELAHLVMDFSLKTIDMVKHLPGDINSLDKEFTHSDFQRCGENLSHGTIPIHFLACCLLGAVRTFTLPQECLQEVYWMPGMEGSDCKEDNLLLLLKATKAAFEAEQHIGTGMAIRNKVMACILQDCLGTVERQYYFFAMIWGWQFYLPFSDIVDKPLMAWCFNLGSALIDIQKGNLSWMVSSKMPLVPALISAATSSSSGIRKGALMCMKKLTTFNGAGLVEGNLNFLLEKILKHSEEILADDRQLPLCLHELSQAMPLQWSPIIQSLIKVLAEKIPMHLKMGLLYALSCVPDNSILWSSLPLAEDILLRISECKEEMRVDVASSTTLYYILLRFSPESSELLEHKDGWSFFVKALTCSKDVMLVKEEQVSPQKILMEQVMTRKFFTSIKKTEVQAGLWSHLISCVVGSEDPLVASRLRSGLRKTSLDAELIVKQIEALGLTAKVASMREAQAKRIKRKQQRGQDIEIQNWKKLGLMLETIGVMASVGRPWLLSNTLCQCLHQSLNLDTVIAEPVQQQILSALLLLLQKSKEELGDDTSKNVQLNVELVVQCIRLSVSPDTHRRAMLILSLAADVFPDLVLHNMMSIFTFMGASLLRRDDSYSFQVIHQTIQSIVPMLIKCEKESEELQVKLAKVCQVFVDAFPDLPEHRRLPLFTQLASTIDTAENLWILLAIIADSHVMRGSTAEVPVSSDDVRRSVPHIIEFAITVCSEFTVLHQVNACYKLMDFISALPEEIDHVLYEKKLAKRKKKEGDVIAWETHSSKQYINFKYTGTALLAHLLSSEKFVAKVVEGGRDMEEELRDVYQLLLAKTMTYLRAVTDSCEKYRDKASGRLWASLQRKIVDVLDGIISVLPANMLLQVVEGLLQSPVPLVRCRATELLCAKLQPSSTFFSKEDLLDLLSFVEPLRKIGLNPQDPVENRQVGLYALQLLTKHLSPHVKVGAIEPIMSSAVQLVCSEDTPMKVVTQALLVIAEAVVSLKAHAVSHLGALMPKITLLLVSCDTDSEHLPLAAATATHKVVESLPQFLSPHLESLICSICRLCAMKEEAFIQESRLGLRLAAMRDSLPQRVETRLMIPKLSEAYKTLSKNELPALQPLMLMLEILITKSESKTVVAQKPAFIELFTQALDLRTVKGDHQSIEAVEGVVCSALGKFLLRLNEHDNIAIFFQLQFWASDVMDSKPTRLITFYRFADHLAGTLKVLFIKAKLADNVFTHAVSILEQKSSNDDTSIFGADQEAARKSTILLKYVLNSLTKIFMYDSVGFTNQERFQLIVQPLINQLENTQIGEEAYKDLISNHFIPCVMKFTSAVGDDSLWKDLNRYILLRLRIEDEPQIILAALETFEALVDTFGEDYLQPLLPDIMPYITEVFETLDPEIEAATKEIYTKMESILGDSFRAYLDR